MPLFTNDFDCILWKTQAASASKKNGGNRTFKVTEVIEKKQTSILFGTGDVGAGDDSVQKSLKN